MISMPKDGSPRTHAERKVRYAVVGLGHLAQAAVLPAFERAAENSELAALVSEDPLKHKRLGKRYRVGLTYSLGEYETCLKSGEIDAVYITLPTSMRHDFAVRAANAGVHVLLERPMAVTEEDCQEMIDAAQRRNVRLMVAYRPRLEEANIKALNFGRSGKLGDLRGFQGIVTVKNKPADLRAEKGPASGALYDVGIHCVNAARYLFQAEPVEVFAYGSSEGEDFREGDETVTALMRFPGGQTACFTAGFGAADASAFQVFGTKGDLRCDPAFEYMGELCHIVTLNGEKKEREFERRNQFSAQLMHFSDYVLGGKEPEVSGQEALADVRVIRGLCKSMEEGRPVRIGLNGAPPKPPAPQRRVDAALTHLEARLAAPQRRAEAALPRLQARSPAVRKPALARI